MINLRNSPFLCFALLLLVAYGIAQATRLEIGIPEGVILALAILVGGIVCIQKFNPGFQYISTIAITLLILSAGMFRIIEFKSYLFPNELLSAPVKMSGKLTVAEVLKVKQTGVTLRCIATALSSTDSIKSQIFTDKYILVQVREYNGQPIFPGDVVLTTGWASSLTAPFNPYAFDIRKYYMTLGIRHQLFCKNSETTVLSASSGSLFRLTAKWQSALSNTVNKHSSTEVAQLTNALVWGNRSDLNEDIREAFADSGAMHVLSVSGMHMAMIYSMLYLMLGAPGSGSYSRRMVRLTIYTAAIMTYMGLTGACPAVVRSGLMIILFLAGKAMGWNTQIWNLLGFAAFLMLWFNPFLYENIGFQLSFLAMAGILMYAQPMIRYFTFKQIILHRIWEITAVSISAQVFILPILLKQFHQFPLTFVASSLVAMPASYVIIFGSIFNIILSFFGFHWLWPWYDKAGYYFIQCMKWMATLNPEMNYSLPDNGSLLLMLMAIVFTIAVVYHWNRGKSIAYGFGLLALVMLTWHRIHQWKQDDLIIYHHYKGLLVDIIQDGQCTSLQDCSLTKTGIEFSTRGYRCYRDIIHITTLCKEDEMQTKEWRYTDNILTLPHTSILVCTDLSFFSAPLVRYPFILIDSIADFKELTRFLCLHEESVIILPAHLDRQSKNRLLKFLKSNSFAIYDISEQGYFAIPI